MARLPLAHFVGVAHALLERLVQINWIHPSRRRSRSLLLFEVGINCNRGSCSPDEYPHDRRVAFHSRLLFAFRCFSSSVHTAAVAACQPAPVGSQVQRRQPAALLESYCLRRYLEDELCSFLVVIPEQGNNSKLCRLQKFRTNYCFSHHYQSRHSSFNSIGGVPANTVKPLFTYSNGQKWLYLLRKVLKLRYGFP